MMDRTHRLRVPTEVEQTLASLQDVAWVAEAFPGATVTSIDADPLAGSVRVQLRDAAAAATVTLRMSPAAGQTTDAATDIEVVTDVVVTGEPVPSDRDDPRDAWAGRVDRFVARLQQRWATGTPTPVVSMANGPVPQRVTQPSPGAARPLRPAETIEVDDDLEGGTSVLPVLLKKYGKQMAGVGAVVLAVVWLVRRH